MDDQRAMIAENVRMVLDKLGPVSGIDFGLNRDSVLYTEGFIERLRISSDFDLGSAGGLVGSLASFLGECIVNAAGGRWRYQDKYDAWGVELPGDFVAFPFTKVRKQFENGLDGGDSIVTLYDYAVSYSVNRGGPSS